MRRLSLLAVTGLMIGLTTLPAFGDNNGAAQVKNVQEGARNASTGWTEIFDGVSAAEGKSQNTAERLVTAPVAGAGIGLGRALHKTGAGVIELFTFWIPKKQPVLNQSAPSTPSKTAPAKSK